MEVSGQLAGPHSATSTFPLGMNAYLSAAFYAVADAQLACVIGLMT